MLSPPLYVFRAWYSWYACSGTGFWDFNWVGGVIVCDAVVFLVGGAEGFGGVEGRG